MKKHIIIIIITLILAILMAFHLVSAESYGSGIYGENIYVGENVSSLFCGDGTCNNGETCSSCSYDCGNCEVVSPGGGGGASAIPKATNKTNKTYECYKDLDCGKNKYCLNNKCYNAECFNDSVCNTKNGETCWNYRCVKLFDAEIKEFESPIKLGEFFDFTYLVKGMANISGDIEINFWIEKDGNKVTSGKDTIYLGNFEEKIKTTKLFLPSNVESGTYTFKVEVAYGTYTAESVRTVEINVKEGLATIKAIPEFNAIGIYSFIVCFILVLIGVVFIFLLRVYTRRNID